LYKTQNTILYSIIFFENLAVYEIMWKNNVEWGRPKMTIWRMRITCCVTNATNKHSGCVIFIPFPRQKWLHKASQCYIIRTLSVLL